MSAQSDLDVRVALSKARLLALASVVILLVLTIMVAVVREDRG
jgi:hypothetical protein